MDTFRPSILGPLIVLFTFAVFHKFTWRSPGWSAGFFHQLADYYLPFLPTRSVPSSALWCLTVGGEIVIAAMLVFQRTRWIALPLLAGFACFVGTVVYGFGSIVLASVTALLVNKRTFEAFESFAVVSYLRRQVNALTWRIGFTVAIGAVFLFDHYTGFTLADRAWSFPPGKAPTTVDVLTPMQFVWFVYSTTILIGVLVAAYRHRSAIASRMRPLRSWATCVLPALFFLSEVGMYTGLKNKPNVAMFSGLKVASCKPNHILAGNHLLSSYFYHDLLFVATPKGDRIGIPVLSLQVRLLRSRRLRITDPLIEQYRDAVITRMRDGVEEPFEFEDLVDVRADNWVEFVLPRRLFFLYQASEADLRCSMPDLFLDSDRTDKLAVE